MKQAQDKAVRFAQNVLQDDDLADELDELSATEYADRKGLVIRNPQKVQRDMAVSKLDRDRISDLEAKLDAIAGIITGEVDFDDDSDDDEDDDDDLS